MKKLLALVLAMVMTLGLATVSSSAAYSDAADVSLNEAVDVMSAVGVFQGADGKFSPKANLNREQAAKLIAYLDLGEDTAEALPAVKVFSDVPATSWSAKYIAYCADAGYIAGDGTGKFNPTGELNGYAFGKMVLCVLGYNAEYEQFVGNNWTIKVAKLMEKNNIADGIDSAASATLTREQAAQYCLNALQADMVEYLTKPTTIAGTGLTVTTGGSNATSVELENETNATDYARKADASSIGEKQLIEKLYASTSLTLYKDNAAENGKNGYTWKTSKNGKTSSVSDFVVDETVLGSSYDGTALYAATGKSLTRKDNTNSKFIAQLSAGYTVWVNGTQYPVYKNGDTPTIATTTVYFNDNVKKFMTPKTADTINSANDTDADINGNGVLIELIDTNNNTENAEKVYFTTYRLAVVNKAPVVKNNSVDGKDYVYVSLSGGAIGVASVTGENAVKASDVKGYEGLAKDDVVTVVELADGPITITKLEGQTGSVSASGTTSLTINGTSTKFAEAADNTITDYANQIKVYSKDVTFFYDAYGYLVRAEKIADEKSSDYLYVQVNGAYSYSEVSDNNNKSLVTFDDGTSATITVAKFKGAKWGDAAFDGTTTEKKPAVGSIYAYTKNDDGTYNLLATTTGTGKDANGAISNGVAALLSSGDAKLKADAGTKFILLDKSGDSYKKTGTLYTGIASVPTLNKDTNLTWKYVDGSDSFLDVVFVTKYVKDSATSDTKYVYALGASFTDVYDEDGDVDYRTFSAIVDGEKTTVKAAANATVSNLTPDEAADMAAGKLYALTYTDGKVTAKSMTLATTGDNFIVGTKIDDYDNGTIEIGDVAYTLDENCKVFVINEAHDTVEVIEASEIDEGTYAKGVTAVTAACGVTSPTAALKNTLIEIYIQEGADS